MVFARLFINLNIKIPLNKSIFYIRSINMPKLFSVKQKTQILFIHYVNFFNRRHVEIIFKSHISLQINILHWIHNLVFTIIGYRSFCSSTTTTQMTQLLFIHCVNMFNLDLTLIFLQKYIYYTRIKSSFYIY